MKANGMLRKVKTRLGANGPGLTVAVIAMLIALTGGALAANGALTGKQKKEVKKIAKKFAGKRGPAGPQGPAGLAGGQGAQGAQGVEGKQGKEGKQGEDGLPGESVVTAPIPTGIVRCGELGGTEVKLENAVEGEDVCNGKEGKEGSPWTVGGSLPAGATETGTWVFNRSVEKFTTEVEGSKQEVTVGDSTPIRVPIPFTLPLNGTLESSQTHFVSGIAPKECKNVEEKVANAGLPAAKPGELCVFLSTGGIVGGEAPFKGIFKIGAGDNQAGANKPGAMLVFEKPTADVLAYGSFAVTAPDPIVTGVSPAQGPAAGGTSVTVTGKNLTHGTVKFGTSTATCEPVNATGTEVVCTSPAHAAETVDVTVTISGYTSPTSAADHFTYE